MSVERSVWEGIVDETKTSASNGAVPVVSALAKRLNSYRETLGRDLKPDTPIFAAGNGEPIRLNNVLRSCIHPVLNRCAECQVSEAEHKTCERFARVQAVHIRSSLARLACVQTWASNDLHDLGVDDHTIKTILRHSSVTVTQRSYIKSLPKHSIAAMETFDSSIAKVVHKRDIDSAGEKAQLLN